MGIYNNLFNNKKKTFSQEEIDEAMELYKDKSFHIYNELLKAAVPEFKAFLIEKKLDSTDFLIAVWAWIKYGMIESPESKTHWKNFITLPEADQKFIFKNWMSLAAGDKSIKFYNTSNENEKNYIFGLWYMAVLLAIGEK